MKQKFSFPLWRRLLLLFLLVLPLSYSWGQTPVYAKYSKTDTYGLKVGGDVIANVSNLQGSDKDKAATIYTYGGVALGLGRYGGGIEFVFDQTIPANQWSYIHLNTDSGLLKGLLGGSLGDLLGNTVGAVALGNQKITVEVFEPGKKTAFLTGNSLSGFKDNIKIVEGPNGATLLAVKPIQAYNKIKVSNTTSTLLLSDIFELDVFSVFTYNANTDTCGKPISTFYDSKGLSLKLLDFTNQMLFQAIDGDKNTASTLSPGSLVGLNVGSYNTQSFSFPNSTGPEGSVNITLAVGSKGLVNANLLGGVEILAYNGSISTPVYSKALSGGLITDLNVLGLLTNGNIVTIPVAPQVPFDRIDVKVNLPVNLSVASSSVHIYDVERFDGVTCLNPGLIVPTPTDQPFEEPLCSTEVGAYENVDFPANAIDDNNESYTTLNASNGSLLVTGSYGGKLEMRYAKPLAANKTSYIRIDSDKEILDALLSGSLGKLLSGVGGLLTGSQMYTVESYAADGTLISSNTSSNAFEASPNGTVTLMQDNIGRYYLAVTPKKEYQSIVISNRVNSLLPTGEVRQLKVYNMCTELGTSVCFPAQFTAYDMKGLNLGLGDLSKGGVKNTYYAIDDNTSSYSELNVGLLGVGATVEQKIFFTQPSEAVGELQVKAFLNPKGLVNLSILGNSKVTTYLNGVKQEETTLDKGVIQNLDLLGLFNRGSAYTFKFPITKQYDRVDVGISSVVGVNTDTALRIYDVKRVSAACPSLTGINPFTDPVCAASIVSESHAIDSSNILDSDFDQYATITSDPGVIVGVGGPKHSGHVELAYANVVPAGKTSYIRFDYDDTILQGLLGGSLGNLVGGLVDGLLLGSHYFDVEVKDASSVVVLNGSSKGAMANAQGNGDIRIVRDAVGRTYIAITPTVPYKSVKITDHSEALVGLTASKGSMNIYSMCYEGSTDKCLTSFATSFDYTGLNLSIKDISGAGVAYPERAIDKNSTNYSEISSGTLAIGAQVKQWIYFNTPSKVDDVVNIKFRTQGGAINLDVLGTIEVKAYLGATEVATLDWGNGLVNGVNVLNLISNNELVSVPFIPGGEYDRISVGLKSVVNVTVLPALRLYDVERTCKALPQSIGAEVWKSYTVNDDATIKTVSGDETIKYTIHVRNTGTENITSFVVQDKLPAGVTYVSSTGGLLFGDTVEFNYAGVLAPADTTTFTITVKVKPNDQLDGIDVIKNIAYVKVPNVVDFIPSYPPLDNVNPSEPDLSAEPGTIILVNQCPVALPKPILTGDKTDLCEGDVITLSTDDGADEYQWFIDGNKIDIPDSTKSSYKTNVSGSYTLLVRKGKCWSELSDPFIVVFNPLPILDVFGDLEIFTKINTPVTYPDISSLDGAVVWYDVNGAPPLTSLPTEFATPGRYVYTAVVTSANGCHATETVIVTVADDSDCPPLTQRVYARGAKGWETTWYTTLFGGVSNKDNATDGNPTTHSTITLGVALFGLGTTWQNIYFDGNPVPAGTPVSIKLGNEYSGLGVGDGITVVGLDEKGKDIGVLKSVDGGLIKLLSADNVFEYTFIPSNNSGPKPYYGVKIVYSAAVGVGCNTNIYGVYYNAPATQCPITPVPDEDEGIPTGINPSVLDIHHGVQTYVANLATALSPFVDPWKAVDNDPESFAYINKTVSVANAAVMTVLFKQQAMPTDELHIDLAQSDNKILSLDLLQGFSIQRFLGDRKVGPQIDAGFDILNLKLLGIGRDGRKKLVLRSYPEPYDRVKIISGTALSVLGEATRIYDVSLNPVIIGGDIDSDNPFIVCSTGLFTIKNPDYCTTYKVFLNKDASNANVGKDEIEPTTPGGLDYDLVKHLSLGKHTIYVQAYRSGCEVGSLQAVYIDITNCGLRSNLNVTQRIK